MVLASNLILQGFNPDFNIFNLLKSTIINLSPIQHVFETAYRRVEVPSPHYPAALAAS
jgi:hypothetical protein